MCHEDGVATQQRGGVGDGAGLEETKRRGRVPKDYGVPVSARVRLRRRRAASLAFLRRFTEGFM